MKTLKTPPVEPFMDKTIPYSHEAEAHVLGSILTWNENINTIGFLTPEDFHGAAMQDIYAAMLKANSQGMVITPFTLPQLIENHEVFKDTGGVQKYLARLSAMGSEAFFMSYAKYVHEMAQKRRIIEICSNTIEEICRENDAKTSEQYTQDVRDAIERVEKTGQTELFADNHKVTQEVMDALKHAFKPIETGLTRLDEAMGGGMVPKKLYGFTARKKAGKTALAATISANLNLNGVRHLFVTSEMSGAEIQQRVISRYTNTYANAFRSEYGRSEDFSRRVAEAMPFMPKNTFYHEAPFLTFQDLKHALTVGITRKKCKGFILDFLQRVKGKKNGQTTAEHLDEVSEWLAGFCRKYNCFGVVTVQSNQEDNTRGGEGIRIACDQLYQLHRDDPTCPSAWLEMLETRYTPWVSIGSKEMPGLLLDERGPYFHEPIPAER